MVFVFESDIIVAPMKITIKKIRTRLYRVSANQLPRGSDRERVIAYQQHCSWPISYYRVTESLIRITKSTKVLEVGVAYGFHANHILKTFPSISYTGVDPYTAGYDKNDRFCDDVAALFSVQDPQTAMDRLFNTVCNQLSEDFPDRSKIMRMKSVDAASKIPSEY